MKKIDLFAVHSDEIYPIDDDSEEESLLEDFEIMVKHTDVKLLLSMLDNMLVFSDYYAKHGPDPHWQKCAQESNNIILNLIGSNS